MIGLSELTVLFLLGLLAIPSILTFIDIMRSNFEGGGKDILASFCNIFFLYLYNRQEAKDCQIKGEKGSLTTIAGKGFAWGH